MKNNSSTATKIVFDCYPFIKVYENGTVERYVPIEKIPPGEDPETGVKSKDVVISHDPAISARIFIPTISNQSTKLPILVYIHGGLCTGSAFDPIYHNYVASLVHKANVIAVSIEYRLAPEHPIPACFEDSLATLKWVVSHANGHGEEPWLNDHADFGHFFLAGESSGANICYNNAVGLGASGLPGVRLEGLVIVHPFFRGRYDKLVLYLFPDGRLDHPGLNPSVEDVSRIGFERILIFVAEKDSMRDSGLNLHEKVKESNKWKGKAELVVNEGAGHVFHLYKPNCEQALFLMNKFVSFINNQEEVNCRSKI